MIKNLIINLFSGYILLASSLNASAAADKEFAESKKCSSHFSYFEKKYDIPKDTLYAISLQETKKKHSKLNIQVVWPWSVNVQGIGHHFKTKDEAIKFTRQKQAEGITSIDVGCMQINLKHHPEAFSSLEQAFSPRRNVAYGAKHLRAKYNDSKKWDKAIGHYHSFNKLQSKKYYRNVTHIAKSMEDYHARMNKLYNKNLFEINSSDNRFIANKEESAMPNEVKTKNQAMAVSSVSAKRNIISKTIATGHLTDDHWFRMNSIPSMSH